MLPAECGSQSCPPNRQHQSGAGAVSQAIDGKWIDVKKATPQDPKASDRIVSSKYDRRK